MYIIIRVIYELIAMLENYTELGTYTDVVPIACALTDLLEIASKRLDACKDIIRARANGETKNGVYEDYTITVSKPGSERLTLDTKTWKIKAPKQYQEIFDKYHTTKAAGKASVTIRKIK